MRSKYKTLFKNPGNPYYKELTCKICKCNFWRSQSRINKVSNNHYCSPICKKKCRIKVRIIGENVHCSKCGAWKNKDSFLFSDKYGYRKWCKKCERADFRSSGRILKQREYMKLYKYTNVGRYNAIDRGKGYGKIFTNKEFDEWLDRQKLQCEYCKVTENEYGRPLGVDRKDSNTCYTIDNICLCCRTCNTCKSNVFTHEEFKQIANKYLVKKFRGNNRSIRHTSTPL